MIPTIVTLQMLAGLLMPPAEFDHYPTEPFTVVEYPAQELPAACNVKPRGLLLACTFVDRREIRRRDDLSPAVRAKVDRHEYGHLNGWVHQ